MKLKLSKSLQFGENAKMALSTLRQHKMRSALTILGVVIGVMSLISVASIMVGLDQDMRGFLEQFGADTLFVFKFSPGIHIGRLSDEERRRKPLTLEDALAIQEEAPAVKAVVAEAFPRIGQGPQQPRTARYKGKEIFNIDYSGTLPSYEQVYNLQIKEGRFFSQAENEHRE